LVDQTSGVKHMAKLSSDEKQQTNSTWTDGSTNQCNGHDANDLALIRKQHFQIENKQLTMNKKVFETIDDEQKGVWIVKYVVIVESR